MVLRVFPSLSLDWVLDLGQDELFSWYGKALAFHAGETHALAALLSGEKYKSPYSIDEV